MIPLKTQVFGDLPMRKIRGITAIILSILFLLPSNISMAAGFRYETEAYKLHALGLYEGASSAYFNPDLGSTVERQVAVILLVKMLGNKAAVEAMPKSDVDSILDKYTDHGDLAPWCRPYMAYAVKNGIVSGTSVNPPKLGPKVLIDGVSFACLILKNLGYTFTRETFPKSLQILSESGGITSRQALDFNKPVLIKDDIVGLIFYALGAESTSGETLAEILINGGVISRELAKTSGVLDDEPGSSHTQPNYANPPASDEEIIYILIRDALLSAASSVTLPRNTASDTADEVFDIVERVSRDNPGILYHTSSTYHSNGRLELVYAKSGDTSRAHYQALDKKANSIVSAIIKPGMTDYEKELTLHDYLVNNCTYDMRSYSTGAVPPESFSAYGALVLGTAVCEGYAEAFKYLLDKVGIPCLIAVGESQGSGHAWNIVTIDGQNYQVDTTWDDPVMENGKNVLSYAYFNLTDEEMAKDHTWIRKNYPACSSDTYNYYVYNKLVVKAADFADAAVELYGKGVKKMTLKISDFSSFNVKAGVTQVLNRLVRPISYMVTEEFGIVDLTIN